MSAYFRGLAVPKRHQAPHHEDSTGCVGKVSWDQREANGQLCTLATFIIE